MVQRRVCATASRPDKGVKQAGFLVLRETSMPSCLIELGFITTADEERLLNTDSGIDNLGRGIYLAFADYKAKYNKYITVPYQAAKQEEATIPQLFPKPDTESKTKRSKRKPQQTVMEELASARNEAAQAATRSAAHDDSETHDLAAAYRDEAHNEKAEANEERKANAPTPTSRTTTQRSGTTLTRATTATETSDGVPVFKVQILASGVKLNATNRQFKGAEGVECYTENGMYKYTIGASANYNEIYRTRKNLLDKFPEAFIIAFKNGSKMDVNQAIREFKNNRNKR